LLASRGASANPAWLGAASHLRCGNRAIALAGAFRYQRRERSAREFPMADNTPAGPVELGAQMDYAEHDKTYHLFLALAKYCSLVVAAILLSLAFLFVAHGSIFASAVLFILICVAGYFLLR
jgi:Bacterial aa3 type cytochrome c oxidase subunit IV